MFLLPGGIFHHCFQRTLANRQCTVSTLPFEFAVASVHVIDGVCARAFEMTNAIGCCELWRNRYNNMNMVFNITTRVNY
jgi:hypothetical protein